MTAFTAMDVQRCIVQFVTSDRLTRYVVINELVIRYLHTREHTDTHCWRMFFFDDKIIFRKFPGPFAIEISRTLSRFFSRERRRRIRKLQKADSLHLSVSVSTIDDRRSIASFSAGHGFFGLDGKGWKSARWARSHLACRTRPVRGRNSVWIK